MKDIQTSVTTLVNDCFGESLSFPKVIVSMTIVYLKIFDWFHFYHRSKSFSSKNNSIISMKFQEKLMFVIQSEKIVDAFTGKPLEEFNNLWFVWLKFKSNNSLNFISLSSSLWFKTV